MEVKLEKTLLILTKEEQMQEVSADLGVSRESLRKWKNKALMGMKKALEEKPAGRKAADWVEEEKLREELEKARYQLKEAEKENRRLERKMRKDAENLQMARHALGVWKDEGRLDIKKNSVLKKLLKNIFSRVPKKPFGRDLGQ